MYHHPAHLEGSSHKTVKVDPVFAAADDHGFVAPAIASDIWSSQPTSTNPPPPNGIPKRPTPPEMHSVACRSPHLTHETTLLDVQCGADHAGVVGASRERVSDVGVSCSKLSPQAGGDGGGGVAGGTHCHLSSMCLDLRASWHVAHVHCRLSQTGTVGLT